MRVFASLVVLASTALCAQAGPTAGTKRYIVGFKNGTSKALRAGWFKKTGARELGSIRSNGTSADEFEVSIVEALPGSLNAPSAAPKAASKFRGDVFAASGLGSMAMTGADDGVLIEEDYRAQWIESMPSFQASPLPSLGSVMASLPKLTASRAGGVNELTWGVRRVRAPAAWDTTEGKGVKVAVIDTGVRTDHPDLNGTVVGGYNAITDSEKLGAWEDDNGHGTHVAGTIAAKHDGKGVVGVAPKSKIYAVKVLDGDGSGTLSDVIKGIIWAANNDMQVANMSLGSDQPSELMRRALRYAKARSVVVVAAAGNSGGSVGYPAAYPEAIAVAASDSEDNLAPFSSRGEQVAFIAPGMDIVSTWPNGNTVSLSGTSMAAPHVAGLAALAVAQGARGLGGPDGVLYALKKSGSCLVKHSENTCFEMIDAGKLVE